jgi:hypothetical protein
VIVPSSDSMWGRLRAHPRTTALVLRAVIGLVVSAVYATGLEGAPQRNQAAKAPPARQTATAEQIQRAADLLSSADADDRISAAEYLARQGPRARPALPQLMTLLDDSDLVCVAAVRAICAVGPEAAAAVPTMVKLARKQLKDPAESSCWSVVESEVLSIGPAAVPMLLAELGAERRTDEVPENMLRALGPQVLPRVVDVLNEGGVRAESAADVIARFGIEAEPALPELARAVKNQKLDELVFVSTVDAIGRADATVLGELRRIAETAANPQLQLDAQRVLREVR